MKNNNNKTNTETNKQMNELTTKTTKVFINQKQKRKRKNEKTFMTSVMQNKSFFTANKRRIDTYFIKVERDKTSFKSGKELWERTLKRDVCMQSVLIKCDEYPDKIIQTNPVSLLNRPIAMHNYF